MVTQRTRTPSMVFAIALGIVIILSGCGLAQPGIGYQGVLTDAAGQPVTDGSYNMEFRLFEINYEGDPFDPDRVPTQVFTQTAAVDVTDGVFDVVIGDTVNPIPVDKMGQEMELEIAVNNGSTYETLSPRQPLVGAPYAFSLYPGAHITDTTGLEGPAVTISKADDIGSALRLDGKLESTATSYAWVNPLSTVEEGTADAFDFYYSGNSDLRVSAKSPGAYSDILIPLSLPGTLLGQDTTLDSVRLYYGCVGDCSAAETRIGSIYLNRADPTSAGDMDAIASKVSVNLSAANSSTTFSSLAQPLGSASLQSWVLRVYLNFLDTNDHIYIRGVRLGFTHQ